jgi:hypothetical protein
MNTRPILNCFVSACTAVQALLVPLLPPPAQADAPAPGQVPQRTIAGPLRVHPTNPRYFTDGTTNAAGSLNAVYLTGSHTWQSLQDGILSNHTREWQYAMVRFVKEVEAKLLKQHPVGMTSVGDMNEDCLKSGADWTSLATTGWDKPKDPWTSNSPAATGQMVCLLDTDHIGWKVFVDDAAFTRAWVWKSFTRGHSTLLMENLAPSAGWIAGRTAMGHTRRLADRVNLAVLVPHAELASTRYCLANPGKEYVVYLPNGGEVMVNLSAASGPLSVEWIHAAEGTIKDAGTVAGGAARTFQAPFAGDAVLHVRQPQPAQR